jgi:hypothetical protein
MNKQKYLGYVSPNDSEASSRYKKKNYKKESNKEYSVSVNEIDCIKDSDDLTE